MELDLYIFHWPVSEPGYQWVQERLVPMDEQDETLCKEKTWVLTNGVGFGKRCKQRTYSPLTQHPALYRTFAELPLDDRDAICGFANDYGLLGSSRMLDIRTQPDPNRLDGVFGETLATWNHAIFNLHRAIEIWRMMEIQDINGLGKFITWEDEEVIDSFHTKMAGWFYDSHPERPKSGPGVAIEDVLHPLVGRSMQVIQPVLDLFKPGDVLMPASFLVQRWINDQLKKHASPRLLYQVELGSRVIQTVPQNLLSAMWLQFARAIEGNKDYRTCKECGKWFEMSGDDGGFRVNRLFCSDACKSRDYRRRKEGAIRLHAEGQSLEAIAQKMCTDLKTIKNWLKGKKKR